MSQEQLRDYSTTSCPESCSGCKHEKVCVIALEADDAEDQPDTRPQNCGTGYCSCIECPHEATQPEQANGGDRVFLVATGEVYEGQETYTRHDIRPPMCDAEVLYTPHPAASVSDAVAIVRERYRGTKWEKAAECICDAVDEAIISQLPAQAGVPDDVVRVPLQVLKDASNALGNFVSDHGWGESDMQAMYNLDAYIARHNAKM